jgi:hypothetical protein
MWDKYCLDNNMHPFIFYHGFIIHIYFSIYILNFFFGVITSFLSQVQGQLNEIYWLCIKLKNKN